MILSLITALVNYEVLIAFIFAISALAIAPGPDNIYVLMQSIVHGKKYGLATVGGLMAGCIIHTALVAFGVSALIQQSTMLFFIIKLFGAIYLFFLAFKVWKSNETIELSNTTIEKKSINQLFRQGFVMNVLNPKVSLFFLAFFPGFLFSDSINQVVQFCILGLIFISVSFLFFGGIAILAGYISDYVRDNAKVGWFMKWLQIIVFIGIGVFVLFS